MSTRARRPDETHTVTIYLHDDGPPLDFALKTTAQVAIVLQIAFLLYRHVWNYRAFGTDDWTRYNPM